MKGQITNSGEVWLAVNDDGVAILDYVSLVISLHCIGCILLFTFYAVSK